MAVVCSACGRREVVLSGRPPVASGDILVSSDHAMFMALFIYPTESRDGNRHRVVYEPVDMEKHLDMITGVQWTIDCRL